MTLLAPARPFDVVVLGAGRVGGSFARALRAAGHNILAELRRDDDPSPIAHANVVVIAVPDDALTEAAGVVARLGRPGVVVIHTAGLQGLEPLRDCGSLVAAVHPAFPIAERDQPLDGGLFGITCPDALRDWCEAFVLDLGGVPRFITEDERARYHAALVMASNFMVALAADAAEILGGNEFVVPLLRSTTENIARLGPARALTGPVVRGDAGTVRKHLTAIPQELVASYVANAGRALALAVASGRLDPARARAISEVLDEAMVR